MATVTCHTPECVNAGVPIDLELTSVDPETGETVTATSVQCGPCGQPITDIS